MKSILIIFIIWITASRGMAVHEASIIYVHSEDTNVLGAYSNLKSTEYITTEPDRMPRSSTGDIIKILRHRQKKVSLVCHGKAAADCLEALILHPDLQTKIKTWIVIDGHIQGAPGSVGVRKPLPPIEDVRTAGKIPLIIAFRYLVDLYSQWFFGFDRVRFHFSPEQRKHYLNINSEAIFKLGQSLDMVSIDQSPKAYGYMPFSRRESRP